MRTRAYAAALLLALLPACSASSTPPECPDNAICTEIDQSAPPLTRPDGTPVSPRAAPAPQPPRTYGGQDLAWPSVPRSSAVPPALGAVRGTGVLRTSSGRTLPAGLLLPRLGGTATRPVVLTPCGNRVTVTGPLSAEPARRAGQPLVLLDPGHGGTADGAMGPGGVREADRNLQIATLTAAKLTAGRSGVPGVRTLLTRRGDHDASLAFRVALADALRADLSVSIHLNAAPLTMLDRPGTSEFGSVSDPNGRRAAGVLYEAHRRYLETLTDRVGGRWAGNPDAGALYRLGSRGSDYYGLLRLSHTTWVIAEPLFLSDPKQAALVADPLVRQGLASAYASGVSAFLAGAPGSGLTQPAPRGADPAPVPGQDRCVDPIG